LREQTMTWAGLRSSATVAPSQVALATPVRTEELTHANIGGQPSHTF